MESVAADDRRSVGCGPTAEGGRDSFATAGAHPVPEALLLPRPWQGQPSGPEKEQTMPNELKSETWTDLLDADPRPWLLESDEPAARWLTLTHLLDLPASDPEVVVAHAAVVSDAGTRGIIARLPAWGVDTGVSGHNSPGYAPNLLHLLADMGVGPGDERVEALLDEMLKHQDAEGRFLFYARGDHGSQGRPREPAWGSLTCDRHAIVEALARFGRGDHPRVALEALRTFARLPASSRPPGLLDTARAPLPDGQVAGLLVRRPLVSRHAGPVPGALEGGRRPGGGRADPGRGPAGPGRGRGRPGHSQLRPRRAGDPPLMLPGLCGLLVRAEEGPVTIRHRPACGRAPPVRRHGGGDRGDQRPVGLAPRIRRLKAIRSPCSRK